VSCRKVKPSYWSIVNKRLFASHRRPLETSGAVNEPSQLIAHREEKVEEDEEEEEGSGRSPNDSHCNSWKITDGLPHAD
jgi:hypothetical protein